jgi:hypothetical protein
MKKIKLGWIVCTALVLSIVGLSLLWISHARYHQELQDNKTELSSEVRKLKRKEITHHAKVTGQANQIGMTNPNKYIANVSIHNYDLSLAQSLSKKFFEVFMTWDNGSSYRGRADLLRNIASTDLLKNKKVFDDGKGVTGDDYIENSGLQSQYENSTASILDSTKNRISTLVKVNYQASTDDNTEDSAIRYFIVGIDKDKAEITDLKTLTNTEINQGE